MLSTSENDVQDTHPELRQREHAGRGGEEGQRGGQGAPSVPAPSVPRSPASRFVSSTYPWIGSLMRLTAANG